MSLVRVEDWPFDEQEMFAGGVREEEDPMAIDRVIYWRITREPQTNVGAAQALVSWSKGVFYATLYVNGTAQPRVQIPHATMPKAPQKLLGTNRRHVVAYFESIGWRVTK